MAIVRVNGIDMYYESHGEGDPIVLVHGGFGDHEAWALVVPLLAESHRVITCDLRGHSQSDAPKPIFLADHVADVAAVIEALDLAPAHVAGYSMGAAVVLRLAAERPDVVASVCAHEPPSASVFALRPDTRPLLYAAAASFIRSFDRIEQNPEVGLPEFIDFVAPGLWPLLPDEVQARMIANASAYFGHDPDDPAVFDVLELDLERLAACGRPVLLTDGEVSPPMFGAVATALGDAVPSLSRRTIAGAGHVPHFTHPHEYAEVIRSVATPATVG